MRANADRSTAHCLGGGGDSWFKAQESGFKAGRSHFEPVGVLSMRQFGVLSMSQLVCCRRHAADRHLVSEAARRPLLRAVEAFAAAAGEQANIGTLVPCTMGPSESDEYFVPMTVPPASIGR